MDDGMVPLRVQFLSRNSLHITRALRHRTTPRARARARVRLERQRRWSGAR
jgi:hypothetical protein